MAALPTQNWSDSRIIFHHYLSKTQEYFVPLYITRSPKDFNTWGFPISSLLKFLIFFCEKYVVILTTISQSEEIHFEDSNCKVFIILVIRLPPF